MIEGKIRFNYNTGCTLKRDLIKLLHAWSKKSDLLKEFSIQIFCIDII